MAVFTESERVEVWDRRQAGEPNRSIGRRLGRSAASIRAFVEASGGVRPAVRYRRDTSVTVKPVRSTSSSTSRRKSAIATTFNATANLLTGREDRMQ